MIFVTVGNATVPFSRLLNEVERLAEAGVFGEQPVIVQSGNNEAFCPKRCLKCSFISMEEFMTLVGEAELIVCHAGAGTLLHVLNAGKVPVVMPRRAQYGEVIDDHQLELVAALAEQHRIVPALEPDDLVYAIGKARQMQARPIPASAPMMVNLVAQAVEELLGNAHGGRSVIRRHKSAA